ncbi:MAG: dihydrodipicolinate synthase family protein [Sedimentisphaeraceae bacterium JB056]
MTNTEKLKGIIPPMITPLLDRNTLDVEGLEKLVEHILGGGVHGLFLLGTTGEAPSLSYKLRYELIEKATAFIGSRVPVLVGISDTSFTESVNVAKKAADCGADAVVLAPPYYFTAGQPELVEYVEHLCQELPLPMYLYNMPGCTKINLEPDTVAELSKLDKIVGLKDSSGNLTYFNTVKTLLADRDDFSLLVGPEELLAQSVLLGADGGVNGGANIFPSLYVELYKASVAGDLAKVRELHAKVMQISTTIYRVGKYGSSFMKSVKCVLKLKGICSDYMEEPFHKFRPAEVEKIKRFLEQEMI